MPNTRYNSCNRYIRFFRKWKWRCTVKNIVISPNFLVWKFCRKAQFSAYFRAIRPKLCGNCAFPQSFHTRKLGEITVFFAVVGNNIPRILNDIFGSSNQKNRYSEFIKNMRQPVPVSTPFNFVSIAEFSN